MKKFLLFLTFCSVFVQSEELTPSKSFEDHVSITDKSLPRLPSPPLEESCDPTVIDPLKGIVLIQESSKQSRLRKEKEGISIDLNVPGHPKKLEKKLTPFLDKPVTRKTLDLIKEEISTYYESYHHPLVLIRIPKQEITNGVLTVLVLESRLGKISVEGNQWTSSKRLIGYMKTRPNQTINEQAILETISFINRNPFRRVDLIYTPGTNPGTTDLVLATKDRRPIRVYSGLENTGAKLTGRERCYAGFNWGNAFGLDHILSYQFTSSFNTHQFHAHTGDYTALLPWGQLLNLYGGYSEVHPKVTYPMTKNDGWSMQTSGRYVFPLKTYRYLEHEIKVGGDFKRTNNTFEFTDIFPVFGSNVNLSQVVVGYSGNYERNTCRLNFNGTLYWSPGQWLPDQSNAVYQSLRSGAVNHWVYFRGSLMYLQKLPKDFTLSLNAKGQGTSQPLLPSEQFGLGGYDTVRGYEERSVSKDQAVLLTAEGRSPPLSILKHLNRSWKTPDALQLLVFLDYGWGINIDQIPGGQKANVLLGGGPGLRYTIDPYFTARIDWGIKLHKEAAYGGGSTMIHFNLTASF